MKFKLLWSKHVENHMPQLLCQYNRKDERSCFRNSATECFEDVVNAVEFSAEFTIDSRQYYDDEYCHRYKASAEATGEELAGNAEQHSMW